MNLNQIIWEIKDLEEQADIWRKEVLKTWTSEEFRKDALQIYYRFQELIGHKKNYVARKQAFQRKLEKMMAD